MGQLIVLGYPDAAEAEEVRRELVGLQQDHLIALEDAVVVVHHSDCLLYTSPSPRDATLSRMPSSA